MLRYENLGTEIGFNLSSNHDEKYRGCSIIARYVPIGRIIADEPCEFTVHLYLQDNAVCDLHSITDVEPFTVQATKKSVKSVIGTMVEQKLEDGEFDKYIERFNYYCKCFEIGDNKLTAIDVEARR